MEKAILILIVSVFVTFANAQMSFVTLDAQVNMSSIKANQDGSWSGECSAYFGVKGNPYTIQSGPIWTGFVQQASIGFTSPITTDTQVINQSAMEAVEEYRKKNYPDTK